VKIGGNVCLESIEGIRASAEEPDSGAPSTSLGPVAAAGDEDYDVGVVFVRRVLLAREPIRIVLVRK